MSITAEKKQHTLKNTVMALPDKLIIFLGRTFSGHHHDYLMLQQELPPELDWFADINVRVDLGYLGMKADYRGEQIAIPTRKPRKSQKHPNPQLSEEQKAAAQFIAVCSASIRAEKLRMSSPLSSQSCENKGVTLRPTRAYTCQVKPSTNSDNLSDLGSPRGCWPLWCARHFDKAQGQGRWRCRLWRRHGHLFFEVIGRQPQMLGYAAVGEDPG